MSLAKRWSLGNVLIAVTCSSIEVLAAFGHGGNRQGRRAIPVRAAADVAMDDRARQVKNVTDQLTARPVPGIDARAIPTLPPEAPKVAAILEGGGGAAYPETVATISHSLKVAEYARAITQRDNRIVAIGAS